MTPDPYPADSTQLVMDVGGSHVTASRVALSLGRAVILHRHDVELDSLADRAEILGALEAAAQPLTARDASWSIAIPGPFDYERGTGSFEGIGKFGGIAGLDLRGALAERLDTQPNRVSFLNDAGAYGIGEWAFGLDGTRPARLVCLTLGTGVGSAFVRNGVVVTSGVEVPTEGAAYTIDYDGKPLEETVSTRAIRAGYAKESGRDLSVAEIARRACVGDRSAAAAFVEAMTPLGRAIGPWLVRFDASILIVGGAMSRSWSLLEDALRAGLAETLEGRALEVRPSRLLDDAPLLGAAEWSQRSHG